VRLSRTGLAVLGGSVVSVGAGVWLRYATLAGAGAAGLAAIVFALAYLSLRPRLSVDRTVTPDRVVAGTPAAGRLAVCNTGRIAAVRFEVLESVGGVPLAVPVPPLAAGQARAIDYEIATPRRGRVQLGPLVLRRTDPLGLARRAVPLAGRQVLWVHPRTHRTAPLPVGVTLDFEGRLTDAAPRGSTAFANLREYAPGDDPRHIHWRSTARVGTLLVREHVDTTEPTVALVLDTRAPVLDEAAFEVAVEVCGSVAVAARRVGHGVALAALGEDRAAVAADGGYDVMDRLAAVGRTASGDSAGLVRLAQAVPGGGCLLVVTGHAEGVLAILAAQRRRFSRVVIVQCGPSNADGTGSAALRRPGLTVLRAADGAAAARALTSLAVR
jgi:uncharacterized protein (DUF58 family)